MGKVHKLVLVTAEHHPLHKQWVRLVEEISKETGIPYEIRHEDYLLLVEYGDTDEFGMAWLPQLLAQMADGGYKLLLSKLPLGANLQPDLGEAKRLILEKIKELEKTG